MKNIIRSLCIRCSVCTFFERQFVEREWWKRCTNCEKPKWIFQYKMIVMEANGWCAFWLKRLSIPDLDLGISKSLCIHIKCKIVKNGNYLGNVFLMIYAYIFGIQKHRNVDTVECKPSRRINTVLVNYFFDKQS